MKRRDFLKSCGTAAVGLPVLAVGAKSETFEARPGFVPAVVIPEPKSVVHWAGLVDTVDAKVPDITLNRSEVTCPTCQKWMYHPAPVTVVPNKTKEFSFIERTSYFDSMTSEKLPKPIKWMQLVRVSERNNQQPARPSYGSTQELWERVRKRNGQLSEERHILQALAEEFGKAMI